MSLSIAASEGVNELRPPVGGELSSVAARTVKIPEVTLTVLTNRRRNRRFGHDQESARARSGLHSKR